MKTSSLFRSVFVLLFLCVACLQLTGQVKVSGIIVDKTNAPIPGVHIYFNDRLVNAVSDINGTFTLSYPDTLTRRQLRLEALSYKTKTMQLNKGQTAIRIVLLDSLYSLQAVTVSVPRQGRFSDYTAQTIQMSSLDIVTNPASMADLLANMRVMPGVQTNDNDGRLIIQGGAPGESQVYIDDLIVPDPYNFTAKNSSVRSRFSCDLFEGIALQSNGYNAEFGQALSGIVNLNTKKRERIETKTDLSLTSVGVGASTQGAKPSAAYRVSANYTNLAPYLQVVPDPYDWHKPYEQLLVDAFFTKDFSRRTQLTAQLYASHSRAGYTYRSIDSIPFTNDMKESYLYAQANLYHTFSPSLSLSAATNLVVNDFRITDISIPGDRLHDRTLWNHSKATLQYTFGGVTNRTGIEYVRSPFRETYTFREAYDLDVDNDWGSLYNDTKWIVTNNLSINIGLRGEYARALDRFRVTPRLYIGYLPAKEHVLSASIGLYDQLPAVTYLKYGYPLDYTSVTKGTFSYTYTKRNTRLQLDAYYKAYHGLVTVNSPAIPPSRIANDGEGYSWGANLFWKNEVGYLEYWLTYSFNHTRKQYDYYTRRIAPDYLTAHNVNVTLKYWIRVLNSLASCNYYLTSGAPWYDTRAPYTKLGTTPLRNRLDVSWSFLPKPWFIIHFGCQNVLGYENIYGYEYSAVHPEVSRPVRNPDKRFYFVGLFITFSQSRLLNQLKSL